MRMFARDPRVDALVGSLRRKAAVARRGEKDGLYVLIMGVVDANTGEGFIEPTIVDIDSTEEYERVVKEMVDKAFAPLADPRALEDLVDRLNLPPPIAGQLAEALRRDVGEFARNFVISDPLVEEENLKIWRAKTKDGRGEVYLISGLLPLDPQTMPPEKLLELLMSGRLAVNRPFRVVMTYIPGLGMKVDTDIYMHSPRENEE